MADNSVKSVNLTVTELLVLLSLKKIPSIYGLFAEKENEITQSQVNEALFRMTKKGIIIPGEGSIKIKDSVEMILKDIAKAKKIVTVSSAEETVPEQCIYVGDERILLRFSGNGSNHVHISRLPAADIAQTLMDSGFSLENNVSSLIMGDGRVNNPNDSFKKFFGLSKEEILNQNNVKAVAMAYSLTDEKVISQVALVTEGMEDYLIFDNDMEHSVYQYCDSILTKYLFLIMED